MSLTAPDPTLDFIPLYPDDDEDSILARMQDWANEGLDPIADAGSWVDTREGGHWQTCVMPAIRELARLYDLAGTEVPMSGMVVWAWGTYLDDLAAQYDVERNPATYSTGTVTFTGPPGTDITDGTAVGTVPASPDDDAQLFATQVDLVIDADGSSDVAVMAVDAGIDGDVAAGAIIAPSTPLPPGVTVTNANPTGGGSDPETDDALRLRVLQAIAGKGPGNVQDYVRWALAWPGVGVAKVVPVWTGPNSVLVSIGDQNGQPLPGATVSALQADLDPVAGQGKGTAPVGAAVTVNSFVTLTVNVSAHITYLSGYTWDGFGGTIAVGAQIQAGITNYLLSVLPGAQVVLAHVAGIIATYPGVLDVSGVQLNGTAANLAVGLTPPQSPILGTVTLT